VEPREEVLKMKLRLLFLAIALSGLAFLSAGCKGEVTGEKLCDYLNENNVLGEDEQADLEDCNEIVSQTKERCSNADEVLSCYMEATSEDGLDTCQDKCEEAEEGGE
jgi:hypothetical protein